MSEKNPGFSREIAQDKEREVDKGSKLDMRLPIAEYAEAIRENLRTQPTFLLIGETGSGKTTQLPLIILESAPSDTKIAITQPRRLAVRSVSNHVAKLYGTSLGQEIGYQIRHDSVQSDETRVTFMTDGIILAEFQSDPLLSKYDLIVVDEAHERSLNIDLTLGLARNAQVERKKQGLKPLQLVVMSATLEKEKFQNFFDQAPALEVPGRLFPVETNYAENKDPNYVGAAAEKVRELIESKAAGDILIFMPGKQEINATIEAIQNLQFTNIDCYPLHGELSPEDQDRIFAQTPSGRTKIIVATNVAETSVTVPGITNVIDSGIIRQMEYDEYTGIEALKTRRHAKSGLVQRAGRAGRVAPGNCYRLFTKEDFAEASAYQVPEIQRSNLARVVLQMKKMGISDVDQFPFVDKPKENAILDAINELQNLGALDENENITRIGDFMSDIPLEPKLGRMMAEAAKMEKQADIYQKQAEVYKQKGMEKEAAGAVERAQNLRCAEGLSTVVAFFGTREVFMRPPKSDQEKQQEAVAAHSKFKVPGSDFLTLLKVWRAFEEQNFDLRHDRNEFYKWTKKNYLRAGSIEEAAKIRYQLLDILGSKGVSAGEGDDNPEVIIKAITAGLVGNLSFSEVELSERRSEMNYVRIADRLSGKIPKDSAFISHREELFVFQKPVKISFQTKFGEREMVLLQTVQEVSLELIWEVAPQLCVEVGKSYAKVQYDVWGDRCVKEKYIQIKGSNIGGYIEEKIEGQEVKKLLITALITDQVRPVPEFHKTNLEIITKIQKLHLVTGDSRFVVPDLIAWYEQNIGNASSIRELNDLGEQIILPTSQIYTEEEALNIERAFPDQIIFNKMLTSVRYRRAKTGELEVVLPPISPDELIGLTEANLPKLGVADQLVPLTVAVLIGRTEVAHTNLAELKKQVRKVLIRQLQEDAEAKGAILSHSDSFNYRRIIKELDKTATPEKPTLKQAVPLSAKEKERPAENKADIVAKLQDETFLYEHIMRAISSGSITALRKNKENIAVVDRIQTRRSDLLALTADLSQALHSLEVDLEVTKGVAATVKRQVLAFFKHKDVTTLLGSRFDSQRVVKLFDVWENILDTVEKNETVRELLDPSKKTEFVNKVREVCATNFLEWLNGQEFSVDEVIEKVLNDFV